MIFIYLLPFLETTILPTDAGLKTYDKFIYHRLTDCNMP